MKTFSRLAVFCVLGPVFGFLLMTFLVFSSDIFGYWLFREVNILAHDTSSVVRVLHNIWSPAFALLYLVSMIPSGLSGLAVLAAERRWRGARSTAIAAAAMGALLMSITPGLFALLVESNPLLGAAIGLASGAAAAWLCWMFGRAGRAGAANALGLSIITADRSRTPHRPGGAASS